MANNGDVYVSARAVTPQNQHGVTALRDTDGNGRADIQQGFATKGGTGLAIRGGKLYFGTNGAILRYDLGMGPIPATGPDTIVEGLPAAPGNGSKSIAIDEKGSLYVDIAAPTDACQPLGKEVTGPITAVTDQVITVEKGKEKWEIARTPETKVTGDLKVGAKVTISYTMSAKTVEVKAAK